MLPEGRFAVQQRVPWEAAGLSGLSCHWSGPIGELPIGMQLVVVEDWTTWKE